MRHLWARCVRYMYAPFECALREVHVCAVCGRAVLVMTVVGAFGAEWVARVWTQDSHGRHVYGVYAWMRSACIWVVVGRCWLLPGLASCILNL
jgi:hypothetical protein